jgi:N-methylhydantoinase A
LTCDLGGTSFDVAHLHDSVPARIQRGDLMGIFTALPRVNVESVGAGGGSVAWIDERRMLRVGPLSVGSSPGPVCYGRGGLRPALTDALLVLGYIDPDRFLGGQMKLDRAAATAACAELGERLGLDALETAWGIRGIALAGMLKAIRARLSGHALLACEHSLVSYGGCGALFAGEVAMKSGLRRVLVPELASVLSAYGAATMDIRRERLASLLLRLPCDQAQLDRSYAALREAVRCDLEADGVHEEDRVIQFEADLRFVGQRWEVTVSLPADPMMGDSGEELQTVFRTEYRRRFGPAATSASNIVELVSLRAVGLGRMGAPAMSAVPVGDAPAKRTSPVGGRRVQIDRACPDSFVSTYNAVDLEPGDCLSGPALVDGTDMTIWVPGGMHAQMSAHSTLIIDSRP